MKLFVALLILFSLFSTSTLTFVELCHLDNAHNVDQNSVLATLVVTTDVEQNQDKAEDSHNHCEAHCTHQVFSLSSGSFLIERVFSENTYRGYLFSFNQTYQESLFRPPLV